MVKRHLPMLIGATLVVGGCVGVAIYIRRAMTSAVAPTAISAQLDSSGVLRPLADVIEQTRAFRLVTVQVSSSVTVSSESRTWRGDATARLSAPVRYSYGVDLAQLDTTCFTLNSLTRTYAIRIPPPARIATEVDTGNTFDEHVETGIARLRSRDGETQLSLARKKLTEEAQRQTLSPADAERVEKETLEAVRTLIQRIVGSAAVEVSYQ